MVWTLPTTIGGANQVLRNSATPGILEWAADQGADHGNAAGLTDDDHTQYALLAGRSGGQNFIGGSGASDNLTIDSSSNATKGNIILNPSGGSVGLGNASPASTFDVNGDIRVGETTNSCTGSNKGAMRYNDVSSVIEFCNGSDWFIMQAAACSDPEPNALAFTDQANASLTTLTTSNILQVNGINCSATIQISGPGSPEFRICSDAGCASEVQGWTSSPSSLVNGQYLQVRQTSSGLGGDTFRATTLVGSGASVWSVSTVGSCASSPAPGTVCADGTIYAGVSTDGSLPMYTTRCNLNQTWNGVACAGVSIAVPWNDGVEQPTTTGFVSPTAGATNSAGVAALTDAASPHRAAQSCEDLNENGNTDWYLPSSNEIVVLYSNRDSIMNLSNHGYWTSTEVNSGLSRTFSFTTGKFLTFDNQRKERSYHVRCVRK